MKFRSGTRLHLMCVLFIVVSALLLPLFGCRNSSPKEAESKAEPSNERSAQSNDGFYTTLNANIIQTDEYWIPQMELMPMVILEMNKDGPATTAGASPIKINNRTGAVSTVCIDPLCRHSEELNASLAGVSCPFTGCSSVLFLYRDELYYVRNYFDYSQKIWECHYVIAAYNTVTGAYREVVDYSFTFTSIREMNELSQTASHTVFRLFEYNGDGYMLKYLPLVDEPKTEEDYVLTLVRVNLQTGVITPLWDRDGKMGIRYTMYAVFDGKVLFSDNAIGSLFYYDLADGSEHELLPGSEDKYGYDHGYFNDDGIGIYDGWIYYCIKKNSNAKYICRLNPKTGEREQLSDMTFFSWCMDSGYIYGEMFHSYAQTTEEYRQLAEPFPAVEGIDKAEQYLRYNTVVRLTHDGTNPERLGYSHDSKLLPMPGGLCLVYTCEYFDFSTGMTSDFTYRNHIALDSTKVPVDDYAFPHPEE